MTNGNRLKHAALPSIAAMAAMLAGAPALAQSASDFAQMRAEIEALRAEQAKSTARINQLETELGKAQASVVAAPQAVAAPAAPAPTQSASAEKPASGYVAQISEPKLTVSGDARVRYEANWSDEDARDRDRGAFRARVRPIYSFNKLLAVGGEVTTGDIDDPNSADTTLGGYNNDFEISLSQAYIRLTPGDFTVYLGKMPQPFVRTDLVWDGDVNPSGASVSYKAKVGDDTVLKANALYFMVDENPNGSDSRMIGGQAVFETKLSSDVKFEFAVGYYDYKLDSVLGADAGDYRSNRFENGRYLSDFNLLNIIGAVQFNQLGENWPIRVAADFVHNFGATAGNPSGFAVDLTAGKASKKGDWRLGYGYSQAGVDAVFAAFSQDNTTIGTNYRQHTLLVDFMPINNLTLNLTYYRFRPLEEQFSGSNAVDDWMNRMRLHMTVGF